MGNYKLQFYTLSLPDRAMLTISGQTQIHHHLLLVWKNVNFLLGRYITAHSVQQYSFVAKRFKIHVAETKLRLQTVTVS